MERALIEGTEISYELLGQGEPVVFVHASPFVEWYRPLIGHLPGVATLLYHRRPSRQPGDGFAPLTVDADAATCARLLDHVGWDCAHVIGHSYGAVVALQLALDAPGRVRTLTLLEPAARGVSSSPEAAAALGPVLDAYRRGDRDRAVDLFLGVVCGAGYRDELERLLPGAFATAVSRADVFFQAEMPAIGGWHFGAADAAHITAPILSVRGADTAARFVEASDLVRSWFPHAEEMWLPRTGHFLMLQRPAEVADGLVDLLERHPLDR